MSKNLRIFQNNSELELKLFGFSGGERHIKIEALSPSERPAVSTFTFSLRAKSANDLFDLALAVDAIRGLCMSAAGDKPGKMFLKIGYFPYARQDRACVPGEACSVKVMADFINAMNFDRVTIFDPHSDVTSALINNVYPIKQSRIVKGIFLETETPFDLKLEDVVVVAPDAGALKKAFEVPAQSYIVLTKNRDVTNGKILGVDLASGDPKGKTCLIVDDICDGGRTFIEAAKLLRYKGAARVFLYVTHGIFSKGFGAIDDGESLKGTLDGIITTDSFYEELEADPFVKVIVSR